MSGRRESNNAEHRTSPKSAPTARRASDCLVLKVSSRHCLRSLCLCHLTAITKKAKMPKRAAAKSPGPAASDGASSEIAAAAAADSSVVDHTTASAPPCPTGGPGGPRCCSRCSTSYARILSNNSGRSSEVATVAAVGHEVAQLQEMLRDAQTRLRLAVDVSKENDVRRGTV